MGMIIATLPMFAIGQLSQAFDDLGDRIENILFH